MNKKLNKLFLILTICISICSTSTTVFADTEYVDGYLRYTVEDGSVTVTGYNGRESEVTIPSKIAGVPVNTIASGAFFNASSVTKVNLPDTIMTIEEGAFTIGQTVVYNSNTSDKVETKPSEGATDENTKEPNKNQTDESNKEPNKNETGESNKEPNKNETGESNKESNKEPSKETEKDEIKESNKETEKDKSKDTNKESSKNETTKTTNNDKMEEDFSVEEVDVDFEDLEDEDTKNTESSSQVSEGETTQNTELNDEVSKDNYSEDDTTEVLATGSDDAEKASTKLFPVISGIVIGGIIVIVGILAYKKKG